MKHDMNKNDLVSHKDESNSCLRVSDIHDVMFYLYS